jgi:hypothetical protein
MSPISLDGWLAGVKAGGTHPVTEIDVSRESDKSPFIVIRHGDYAVVINPLAFNEHLSVDLHPYADGVRGTAGAFGMTDGRRVQFPDTGSTSHGWPSTALVVVLVGEQA